MEINKKRFTISVAKKLLYMLEGRTLPSSSLPRWIVDELRIEGLITGITNGSRVSYRLTDTVAFGRYISDNYTFLALLSKDGLKSFLAKTKTCSAVCLYRKPATPRQ